MNKILFKEKEKELMRFVQDFKVNITENDMFNLLKIKRRWPARTHTYEQATVEVIDKNGNTKGYITDKELSRALSKSHINGSIKS